ncbi:MAG: alpha/beta fold hydrolase [Bacteroidota bacterium]
MEKKSLSLYHIIKAPVIKREKSPVLFMFHGYGSNEEDLFSFAPELPDTLFIISVRAPYELMHSSYAWNTINFDAPAGKWSDDEQAKESRDRVVTFIGEACHAYDLDVENVSLLGFSQGTILSYAVALSYPEKVKNIIALSGYINTNIIVQGYEDKDHSKLHFYCSHGSLDQVLPVAWARQAPEILDRLKIEYIYEEFPVGHGVAPENLYAFKHWLDDKL